MEKERDALNRIVMPTIRRACEQRGVSFSYIDLRWGIDDEMLLQDRVIGHCLEQIDITTPVFLGLIGPRYGSILAHKDTTTLSATHHEFRQAYLREREMIFMVCETDHCREARAYDQALVQMLEETPENCRNYYRDIKNFIELAEKRLMETLDRLHPKGFDPNPVAEATVRQSRFQSVRSQSMEHLWQGEGADAWLGYLHAITQVIVNDDNDFCGILPLIVETAGDAESVAVELAQFYRKHGPAGELVFEHARSVENDQSARWVMRRLLAYLKEAFNIGFSLPAAPTDTQVQLLLNMALAEMGRQEQRLVVVLSRPDPVEILLYMRPLLVSGFCSVVAVLTEEDSRTLPINIASIPPPECDLRIRRSILKAGTVAAGKGRALPDPLIDTLASSPLCGTLTGTRHMVDWLAAWGDLNPNVETSQDAWVRAEIERVACFTSLEEISHDALSAATKVMTSITPEFEELAQGFMDCLRVAPSTLEMGELQEVVEIVFAARGTKVDLRRGPLAMSYLGKVFSEIHEDAHNYRLLEPALWPLPDDTALIASAIVRALIKQPPNHRRAECVARCANITGQERDAQAILRTPGFAALIEISLLTPLAAEQNDLIPSMQKALCQADDAQIEAYLVNDSLALITALFSHKPDACMQLYEFIASYVPPQGPKRDMLTAALAAKVQTALDQYFSQQEVEFRQMTGGQGAALPIFFKPLHTYNSDKEIHEAHDFFSHINEKNHLKETPETALWMVQHDLYDAFALDTFGPRPAWATLEMLPILLRCDLSTPIRNNSIRMLCVFAIELAIVSENSQWANSSTPTLEMIDRMQTQNYSLLNLGRSSRLELVMKDLLKITVNAVNRKEITLIFFKETLKEIVEALALSDRRFEYHELLRIFTKEESLIHEIKSHWEQHHQPSNKLHAAEIMVRATEKLRRMTYFD